MKMCDICHRLFNDKELKGIREQGHYYLMCRDCTRVRRRKQNVRRKKNYKKITRIY